MRRALPCLAALAIILPTGLVHGLWTGRWSKPETFEAPLGALARIPLRFGAWTGRDLTPEEKVFERAGVAGGLMRAYDDGHNVLTIMIVCGRPGPTSVHTPEACYGGAGYDAVSAPQRVALPQAAAGSAPGDFWVSDFRKQDALTPDYLRIFYAWSLGGTWRASDRPRLDFAGSRSLYKMYVIRRLTRIEGAPGDDSTITFLRQFLPEVEKALRPAP